MTQIEKLKADGRVVRWQSLPRKIDWAFEVRTWFMIVLLAVSFVSLFILGGKL